MAEDTINTCSKELKINWKPTKTENLQLHGYLENEYEHSTYLQYGTDEVILREIQRENPDLVEYIHPHLPYTKAEVVFAVRYEMDLHLEDFLSRRTRSLLLDAKASIECSYEVAQIMAKELGCNNSWVEDEVKNFKLLAENYLIPD